MNTPQKLVCFLHLPRTAGGTAARIMKRQYPKGAVAELFLNRPHTCSAFLELNQEQKENIHCVLGHMLFGVHEYFPGRSPTYVTIFRDSDEQLVSAYSLIFKHPEAYGPWLPPAERTKSFEDYLRWRMEMNLSNMRTRMIGGYGDYRKLYYPVEPLPEDALEKAKENLEKYFSVVGFQDKFDETLLLMKRTLGWKRHIISIRFNFMGQSYTGSRETDLSEEAKELIALHNNLDIELLGLARKMFEKQLGEQDASFEKELRRQRRYNKLLFTIQNTTNSKAFRRFRKAPIIRNIWSMARVFTKPFK